MAQEFYIECPRCHTVYSVHKTIYDRGPTFLMYCPNCLLRYPRNEGKVVSANFPIENGTSR